MRRRDRPKRSCGLAVPIEGVVQELIQFVRCRDAQPISALFDQRCVNTLDDDRRVFHEILEGNEDSSDARRRIESMQIVDFPKCQTRLHGNPVTRPKGVGDLKGIA